MAAVEEEVWIHVISSEAFWNWIVRWRGFVILAVISFAVALAYVANTVVIIQANSPTGSGTPKLSTISKTGKKSAVISLGSIAILPRDTDRIEAIQNGWQTSVDITPLPWVGIKEINIAVQRDRNVEKVSGDSLGCTVYDSVAAVTASYSCSNPSGLYTYKTSDKNDVSWGNEAYLTFPQSYSVVPFKNGLLGITNSKTPQLFYADMTTKAVTLPLLPQGMDASRLADISLIGNTGPNPDRFLLIDRQEGTVYYGDATENAVSYRRFILDKKWLLGASVTCALYDEKAHCYVGGSTASPDSHDETEDHKDRTDGRIVSIDFASDTVNYQQSAVPKSEPIDQLYVDGNQHLYGLARASLYSLDTQKAFVRRTIVTASASSVAGGKTLYYVVNGKLYELNSETRQTFLRFSSDLLKISTITQTDSQVFIDAHAVDAPAGSKLHTYQLLTDENMTPGERLVDTLNPYPSKDFPGIVNLDYHQKNIHVVIPDYVEYDKNGKLVSSVTGADIAKQEATAYLDTLVHDIGQYTITFSRATK